MSIAIAFLTYFRNIIDRTHPAESIGYLVRGCGTFQNSTVGGSNNTINNHQNSVGKNMTENRNIHMGEGSNYNERIEGNYYEQSGNFGIGHMSGGKIKGNPKIAGVINKGEKQDLAEAAAEIQTLIEQLEQTYPTNTTTEQMAVATKVIEQIENNSTKKQKAIAALKQGSLKAIETHSIGAFIVGAIKGWKKQQDK